MIRTAAATLPALFLAALTGCLSVSVEGQREGLPRVFNELHHLELGRSTLTAALHRLGPPDLLLRVGEVDRLYYVSWDSFHFKLTISAPVPFPGRSASTDAFILGLGSEDLRLARLEFDRMGILRVLQSGSFGNSTDGEYIALDNRVVETFLEDRSRVLRMIDVDDDDDDDPRPPLKK